MADHLENVIKQNKEKAQSPKGIDLSILINGSPPLCFI